MKKRDLLSLHKALTQIEGRQFTVKFSYFVAKNKVLIKDEFAAIEEARKPSAAYVAYDTKRAELAHEMSDRDSKGSPKIENNNFIITERVDEFRKALDDLKESNKEVIENQNQKNIDFEKLLDEEIEYRGPKIDLKDIPQTVEPAILEVLILADLIVENA
jgi:hypothetical protein